MTDIRDDSLSCDSCQIYVVVVIPGFYTVQNLPENYAY